MPATCATRRKIRRRFSLTLSPLLSPLPCLLNLSPPLVCISFFCFHSPNYSPLNFKCFSLLMSYTLCCLLSLLLCFTIFHHAGSQHKQTVKVKRKYQLWIQCIWIKKSDGDKYDMTLTFEDNNCPRFIGQIQKNALKQYCIN